MFKLAEIWGIIPFHTNPTYLIQAYPEKKRERFLSTEEVARLNFALDEGERMKIESPYVVAAFKLLIYTGCRLGETGSSSATL
jgi:integrase